MMWTMGSLRFGVAACQAVQIHAVIVEKTPDSLSPPFLVVFFFYIFKSIYIDEGVALCKIKQVRCDFYLVSHYPVLCTSPCVHS